MAEITIRIVGTLYLGGQSHGFPPGSVLTLPSDQAEPLIAGGHAVLADPAPVSPPE